MPRIDTSSDMYQNRDRSLTTYKKDLDQSVAYKDLPRPDEKQRVREFRPDITTLKNQATSPSALQRELPKTERLNEGPSKTGSPEQKQSIDRQRAEPLPALYEPRKAPTERPVDASSFITGGTVDVRA